MLWTLFIDRTAWLPSSAQLPRRFPRPAASPRPIRLAAGFSVSSSSHLRRIPLVKPRPPANSSLGGKNEPASFAPYHGIPPHYYSTLPGYPTATPVPSAKAGSRRKSRKNTNPCGIILCSSVPGDESASGRVRRKKSSHSRRYLSMPTVTGTENTSPARP